MQSSLETTQVRFCREWLGSLLPSFSNEDSALSALLPWTTGFIMKSHSVNRLEKKSSKHIQESMIICGKSRKHLQESTIICGKSSKHPQESMIISGKSRKHLQESMKIYDGEHLMSTFSVSPHFLNYS